MKELLDAAGAHVHWRTAMRRAIRDPRKLCQALGLDVNIVADTTDFPTFVPWEFVRRMEWGNPRDPLLLQVLPTPDENKQRDSDSLDPVGDCLALADGGLIHKYQGRALLVVNNQCAAHCRYCFRRYFPYSETGPTQWQSAFEYLAKHDDIEELILSGGDPLTLSDLRLQSLVHAAAKLPNLRRLRVHTRLPVLIPQRVTEDLVRLLTSSHQQPWLVIHANHPNEVDGAVVRALQRFQAGGIPVLNQAVLLHGVNDDVDILTELCSKLVDVGVMPYYLHQLDPVAGASHFHVPIEHGRSIVRELRRRLPGYAVPKYVQDHPGSANKIHLV